MFISGIPSTPEGHVKVEPRAPRPRIAVLEEALDADGWLRVELTFQDARHAEWAIWQLATDAEVVAPPWLRDSVLDRAAAIIARYDVP